MEYLKSKELYHWGLKLGAEKEKHKFKRRGTLDVQFYWNFVLYHVMAYYGSNHNQ